MDVTIPQTLQVLLELGAAYRVPIPGNGLQRAAWHGSPAVPGLLGDAWHIANLFMTHQTIYSDFFNSITRPFGSQIGKENQCMSPAREAAVAKQPAPQESTGLGSCTSQTKAAMLPGQWDASQVASR